jgi:hypothetical protein
VDRSASEERVVKLARNMTSRPTNIEAPLQAVFSVAPVTSSLVSPNILNTLFGHLLCETKFHAHIKAT